MEQHNPRYLKNTIEISTMTDEEIADAIGSHYIEKLNEYQLSVKNTAVTVRNSSGKEKVDPFIYIGLGGNLYLNWRMLELQKRLGINSDAQLKRALESFHIIEKLILEGEKDNEMSMFLKAPSFFLGHPGPFTIGAILYSQAENGEEKVKSYVDRVLKMSQMYMNKEEWATIEDELLYGSSGYLYCLLLLKTTLGQQFHEELVSAAELVFESIIHNGTSIGFSHLYYTFPKGKSAFLGAAHGTIGIMYILIRTLQVMPALKLNRKQAIEKIKTTVDYLWGIANESGNWPPVEGSSKKDILHFCHGSPGAIPLFIEASNFFKDEKYFETALTAGELTWKQGLLTKGFGLCHGISGNAYFFMDLYKQTGDEKWKKRAYAFMMQLANGKDLEK